MNLRFLSLLVLLVFGLAACSNESGTPFEKQLDSLRKEKATI